MDTRVSSFKVFPFVLLACALQGCGDSGSGTGTGSGTDPTADAEADIDVQLSGSVGDGPIANAQLVVKANNGQVLQNAVSSQLAGYDVVLKAKGKYYALAIEATGGTDLLTNLPPEFKLKSAALDPRSGTIANLNPFTTLAVATAGKMSGGATATNIKTALDTVVAELNTGLTTLAGGGVMNARIDATNLTQIVKSSETLAELLRRVNAIRVAAGKTSTVDDVIDALGADLSDGKLDGRGASGTDAQASAAAVLVGGQVVVEALTNTLQVNGQPAAAGLDRIITQLSSSASPTLTGTQPITAEMIAAARVGAAAANAITPSTALATLGQRLNTLTPGMLPTDVASTLQSGASPAFAPALTQITAGAASDVNTVNAIGSGAMPSTGTNSAPTISGSPATTATVGVAYSFQPTAADADSNPLTFSIGNRPAWATFNASTGLLSGTPAATDVGTFTNIAISVSDGTASTQLPAFSITVAASNTPPVISGAPPTTATVGVPYAFTPVATDVDAGTTLRFSIANKPAWATFTTSTGALKGTPASGNVGATTGIVITVSDGVATASLPAFTLTVSAPPNRAPTISGTPSTTVIQGSAYAFTPSASDPDGNALSFSIVNKPAWATFSASTGALTGTPAAGDVGTTSGIVITVSDGTVAASLPAFSLTVQAVGTASVTLSWTPPTQNTDGSALTNLAGYKVYWGTVQGTYPNSVTINNPGISAYVVTNLGANTYYFVTTSINSTGVESAYSNVASKTLP